MSLESRTDDRPWNRRAVPKHDTTFSPSMKLAVNYRRWLRDTFADFVGERVLEVGIGDGGYFSLFSTGAEYYVGLDLDPMLIAEARKLNPDCSYVQGDISNPSVVARFQDQEFDTILCFNVLEHIKNDRAAIRNMVEILGPSGHLLLFVPAFRALYNDLDRLAGHFRRYRLGEVRSLLPPAAVAVELSYFNPLGGMGWWLNRFVKHTDLETRVGSQIVSFDRFVLPASRFLTPTMKRLFGQSIVCVARKP